MLETENLAFAWQFMKESHMQFNNNKQQGSGVTIRMSDNEYEGLSIVVNLAREQLNQNLLEGILSPNDCNRGTFLTLKKLAHSGLPSKERISEDG